MKIGVFGSAFNPPTKGHMDCIKQIMGKFDKIILVPSYSHAFGKNMINFDTRVKMTTLAIEENDQQGILVSSIEKDIFDGSPIYTWQLMMELERQYPNDQLTFVCGVDNAENFKMFDKSELILKRWGVCVVEERKKIRSTLVRQKVAKGESIIGLVPENIIKIIEKEY